MNQIAVVGAGAMGSYFAARLAEAGHHVVVIDVDENRLGRISQEGIIVTDDAGTRTVAVSASLAAGAAGPVDLVIVFTKGMHTSGAASSVRRLAGPGTAVLTLQNGLGNDDILAEIFGADHVIIGMTDVPADLTGSNSVSSHGRAQVVIGCYSDGAQRFVDTVAGVLGSAGFVVEVDPKVRSQIWEKVAFNAAMNATAAVTGFTVGGLDTEPGRRIIDASSAEVADVAERLGLRVDRNRIAKKIANALAHHRNHKPSMLQDRLAGRKTEIENINGAVVRIGDKLGVPVATNRVLTDLVRMLEG